MQLLTNNVPAGSLRSVVSLYAAPLDGNGKPKRDALNAIIVSTPELFATVRARLVAQSGSARYATEQYVLRMSHVITIRYRGDVARGMQVRFEGKRYNVQYCLDPEERHRWLHLLCLEEGL